MEPSVPSGFEPDRERRQGWSRRWPARAVAGTVGFLVLAAALPSSAQDDGTTTVPPSTTAPPSTLSAEQRAAKEAAAGELNAAKADDTEIAEGLRVVNTAVQETQSKIDEAQRQLEVAKESEQTASEEVASSSLAEAEIEAQLKLKAIEGFKSGVNEPGPFFSDQGMNATIRQNRLLSHTTSTTFELLQELRNLREENEAAQAQAAQAASDAEALEQQLRVELEKLHEQQDVQLRLKREAESRISKWEAELTAYAAQDGSIRQLIADSSASDVVVSRVGEPSELGFQWPVQGPVTSPYGYRVHPIYGTRKLHSGLDIGGGVGTPIAATSSGRAIFVGVQGGYGNTVIIDHGSGVTSLYAHMSSFAVSQGATVARGDVIGAVGATGNVTGPHLHFEIRVDGSATDPRPYLP